MLIYIRLILENQKRLKRVLSQSELDFSYIVFLKSYRPQLKTSCPETTVLCFVRKGPIPETSKI